MLNNQQLDLIRHYQPKIKAHDSMINAAVSLVLRNSARGPEFLLMQRAKHINDPWSGQMAFPGGKFETQDASYKQTAIRETEEEVGLGLQDSEFVGQLDDVYGVKASGELSVHVACFVFIVDREVILTANHEVADMLWLPLSFLENPANAYEHSHPHDASLKMPAVLIDRTKEQILWGLSLRMLLTLYTVLGLPMATLSSRDKDQLALIEKQALSIKNKSR